MFLINASIRRETLKYALPPKTLQQEGNPHSSTLFRVVNPLLRPFVLTTSYQMGGRSPSPATPYEKWGCSNERAATHLSVAVVDGNGRAIPNPTVATPCSADANLWTGSSVIPKSARPGTGGGPMG